MRRKNGHGDTNHPAQVFDHWDRLKRLVRRRFPNEPLADEALSYVIAALAEDDWRRIRSYRGEASFTTFLNHITYRLLEDFSRHKWGRHRPPKWITAQGSLFEAVYRLLCVERMSRTEVIESLRLSAPGERAPSVISEAITIIRRRIPHCGQVQGEILYQSPKVLEESLDASPLVEPLSPEEHILVEERDTALKKIYASLMEPSCAKQPIDDQPLGKLLPRLRAQLSLSTEERLFLKMIYQDGLTTSAAGRLLGWNSAQAHGRWQRLMERIRRVFAETGLLELLEDLSKE